VFADQLFVPFVMVAVSVWVLIVIAFGFVLNYRVHHGPQ
jgi:hypothetical protein